MKIARLLITIPLSILVNLANAQNTELLSDWKNNLIRVKVPLPSNDTLLLYTDTGGKNYLYKTGLKKLGLKKAKKNLWNNSLESIFEDSSIPMPLVEDFYFIRDNTASEDGMLGREWFAGKAWLFDYKNQILSHLESELEFTKPIEIVRLSFNKDSLGNQSDHLPRINIVIDNDTLSFLFDTGAQAFLSDEAQLYFGSTEKTATSFINASYFEKWEATHSDWQIIRGGDESFGEKADMIVVPQLKIGSHVVGPVAFARREDINFEIMSERFMDEEIVGAIGGNALSLLGCFIIDYPNETLKIPCK